MEDTSSTVEKSQRESSILADLSTKLSQMLNQTTTPLNHDLGVATIGIKLDGTNYGLWSQIVEMYISGKDKLGYINGDLPQPDNDDATFNKWRTENAVVKGWLINSMDPKLIGNYIIFPTAKAVWDAAATTYFDGMDTSQVYDLKRKVMRLKQGGGSIETYYNNLQSLWRKIDFRRPNPMRCEVDIQKYNSIIQEDRVYTFLDGLDDRLDKIRGDVLQTQPFPMVEQAYALVRREDLRQAVMLAKGDGDGPTGVAMLSKGGNKSQPTLQLQNNGKSNTFTKVKPQGDGGGCSHCGNTKHTRETCFKLHGYPEWWHELKNKKKREANGGETAGRMAFMNAGPSLSLVPQEHLLSPMATSASSHQDNQVAKANKSVSFNGPGYSQQGDHWSWY